MVSNVQLAQISLRLEEIFPNSLTKSMGDQNFISFGDLLQLPPVGAEYIFEKMSLKKIKNSFGGIPLHHNLWLEMEYYELTENMRQKDDLKYAQLLSRVRIGNIFLIIILSYS
jgi:hypothetical protein